MTARKRAHPQHQDRRTTVRLQATTRTTQLYLDHASDLALHYAQHWHQQVGALKVPASGLIRRALQHYAVHLGTLPGDELRGEFTMARGASASITSRPEDQQAAWSRLEAAKESAAPLPPFLDIASGCDVKASHAALDVRVNAIMEEVARSRYGRMRGIKTGSDKQ